MRFLPAIFANVALLISALGFGRLLRRFFPDKFSVVDRVALTILGGLGLLGTILFCVGQIWFSRTAIILVLLLGVLLSIALFGGVLRAARAALAMRSAPLLPLAIIASVLAVTVVGGFAKPTFDMNSDAIAYHYYGPKVWLRDALIRPVPDETLTAFPAEVETLFAALMSLGGERAPQLFSVVAFVSLLMMAASLSLRAGLDSRAVWWVLALTGGMPVLYRGAYDGYIDVLFAGFLLAAARIAFDAVTTRDYALFGIFCGISLAAKYTALISWVLLILCCFAISILGRRQSPQVLLRGLGVSCAVAIVIASPFYLRNWVLFGSPIYPPPPGLLRIFPAAKVLPAVLLEIQKNVAETGAGMGRSLWSFLLLPFNLTYHTADFRGAGGIGLAPLAFAPLGLIAWRRDLFVRGLAFFAFLQMIAWFFTAQVSRYALHIYVLVAIFAVLGWQYVSRVGSKYARALSCLIIACSVGYGLYMIFSARVGDMHAALSPAFEEKRRHAVLPYLASFDYLNADPSVSKVLILDPYVAAYYSDKPFVKPLGRWGEQTLPDATNLPAVLSQARTLHVSHILDVIPEAGPLKLPENPPGLTLVFHREDQRVYRID